MELVITTGDEDILVGPVDHREVVSSNIESLTYYMNSGLMDVEFKGGSVYRYQNVPHEMFVLIAEADSVGSVFNMSVRKNPDVFPYTCIVRSY